MEKESELFGNINNKISLVKQIGSGGTAKVYQGYLNNNPSKSYAVKVIRLKESTDSKYFSNEITLLKELNHPNVVCLIEGGEGIMTKSTGSKTIVNYLVLDLIKYGELFDFVFFPQKGFGEDVGRFIINQVLDGLEACHKAGVVHRDMKTENLMLDQNWRVKIADFGFASRVAGKKGNGLLYTALGTANYACPELLMRKPYQGIRSDIFSFGVSTFVIVTGKMPFKHAILEDNYYKEIAKGNYEAYWEKLKTNVPQVSDDYKDLFLKLVSYDPVNRPTIEEIRKHKWLCSYKPNMEKINKDFSRRLEIVEYKKEVERRMEQQQKANAKKFQVYKHEQLENEYEKTSDDLEIRELEPEDLGLYSLRFTKEKSPGDLFDFVIDRLSKLEFIDLSEKYEGKYIVHVGCGARDSETRLNNEFVLAPCEMSLEVVKLEEGLAVLFEKVTENKFDFHNLFTEVANRISSYASQ